MDLQEARRILEDEAPYRFAKTMASIPHSYTRKNEWSNPDKFVELVEFIRSIGYAQKFYSKTFIYININRYKYWTYGDPVQDTILINRAEITPSHDYDRIAPNYDRMFNTQEAKEEEQGLIDMMGKLRGYTLDVGCGTGLLLHYRAQLELPIASYTGIDPSREMLKVLYGHYQNANLVNTRLEDFVSDRPKYDNVIALFSASYIEDLSALVRQWSGRGVLFAVFYAEDAKITTHVETGVSPTTFFWSKETLCEFFGVDPIEYTNYYVINKHGNL